MFNRLKLCLTIFILKFNLTNSEFFIMRKNETQTDCVTNSTGALSWLAFYDIREVSDFRPSTFIPKFENINQFDCEIGSNMDCTIHWRNEVWQVEDTINNEIINMKFIWDRRFESLPFVIKNKPYIFNSSSPGNFEISLSVMSTLLNNPITHVLYIGEQLILHCNDTGVYLCENKIFQNSLTLTRRHWYHYILKKVNNVFTLAFLNDTNRLIPFPEIECEVKHQIITDHIKFKTFGDNIWKIHNYEYIYTIHNTKVSLGPQILVDEADKSVCIAMFIYLCRGCYIELSLSDCHNNILEHIPPKQFISERKWGDIKHTFSNITSKCVRLGIETKNTSVSNVFWAIDSPRICHETEYRHLTTYGSQEISICQLLSESREDTLSLKIDKDERIHSGQCFIDNFVLKDYLCADAEICRGNYCGCTSSFNDHFCNKTCSLGSFQLNCDEISKRPTEDPVKSKGDLTFDYYKNLIIPILVVALILMLIVVFKFYCLPRMRTSTRNLLPSVKYSTDIPLQNCYKCSNGRHENPFKRFENNLEQSLENGELVKQFENLRNRILLPKSVADDKFFINGFKVKNSFLVLPDYESVSPEYFWNIIMKYNIRIVIWLSNETDELSNTSFGIWPNSGNTLSFTDIFIKLETTGICANYECNTYELKTKDETRNISQFCVCCDVDRYTIFCKNLATVAEKLLKISLDPKSPILLCTHKNNIEVIGIILVNDATLRMAARDDGDINLLKNFENMQLQSQKITFLDFEYYKIAHLVILDFIYNLGKCVITCDEMKNTCKLSENHFVMLQMIFLEKNQNEENARNNFAENEILSSVGVSHYDVAEIQNNFPYITAAFVDGFRAPRKFIATKQPEAYNVGDFWKMVVEYDSSMIVILDISEFQCQILPKHACSFITSMGEIVLIVKETRIFLSHKIINVDVTVFKKKKTVEIVMFTNWSHFNACPNNLDNFWEFWAAARNAPVNAFGITIVMCRNGTSACGLFVALSFILDRLEAEKVCDAYQGVVSIRKTSKKFEITRKQLIFIYNASQEYRKLHLNTS